MSEHHGRFCPCCSGAAQKAMSRHTFLNMIAGTAAGLAIPSAFADEQAAPSIAYDSVANPVVLPKDFYFGECAGVALSSHGHIFVLSRGNTTGPGYGAAAAQLLAFSPNGRFIRVKNMRQVALRHVLPSTIASNASGFPETRATALATK
ncbi:hypothetical protein J8I87_31175 [Paraburkholderia sp. LEh10]|uniref:hypothetical protein n=1 Tax=Paraburkholderia sp. LEh10 TaxID=2821353 RepID=UPI001AE33F79|nr:hypothetical protein [Paraburkholderia sp. LEh10]MBP0594061.1 hypothetical protein [Paraburkholderia sp. LEh10]